MKHWAGYGLLLSVLVPPALGWCQKTTVMGHIDLTRTDATKDKASFAIADKSNIVVWLTPVDNSSGANADPAPTASQHAQLVQKDKSFKPHILVIPVGTVVEFPNRDPIFHNVFSLFEGKRFDLGLYEAGTTRAVRFDHPGISYIFCNIHPEMSAVVVVMSTPYYGISDRAGQIGIANVPPGRYILHVWHERSLPEMLKNLTREIVVPEGSTSFGTLHIREAGSLYQSHKNKYGRDYDPPEPVSPVYSH
jgi:plastocyanin